MIHTAHEYVGFIVLLGSLYIISGGILLQGSLSGTPLSNTALLGMGAVLANFIGTTGASMVLIRPLLRANASRLRRAHIIIFFIFLVSNIGGLLTPLGDPPLFLGFLRGVPFTWTFQMWREWLLAVSVLLVVFNFIDQRELSREEKERPGSQLENVQRAARPFHIQGTINLFLLAGIIGAILVLGPNAKIVAMAAFSALSLLLTRREIRTGNSFTWGPIVEVTFVFAGIFATMVPALMLLESNASSLPMRHPWQYFWATGILSSFLDNAPAYLALASAASGLAGTSQDHLNELITASVTAGGTIIPGEMLLVAISLGAVFMGASTYIGNGPNFMVKSMAEGAGIKMPSFLGYMKWSSAVLLPLFAAVTFIFLR